MIKQFFQKSFLRLLLIILIILITLSFINNEKITGKVISLTKFSNCDQSYLEEIWDQAYFSQFQGSNFSKLESFSLNNYSCQLEGFILINSQLKFINIFVINNSYSIKISLNFITGNLSQEGVSFFNSLKSKENYFNQIITNISLKQNIFKKRESFLDISNASFEFSKELGIKEGFWEDKNSIKDYLANIPSFNFILNNYSLNNKTNDINEDTTGFIGKNDSFSYYYYNKLKILNGTYYEKPNILKNISNKLFSKGIEQKFITNLNEISNNFLKIELFFTKIEGIGEINFNFTDDFNNLYFNLSENSWGKWNVRLDLLNAGPNKSSVFFNFSILENTRPEKIKKFETIVLDQNSIEGLELKDYFKDIEESSLNYSISHGKGIKFSLKKNYLEIQADNTYFGKSWLKILASDGKTNTSSGVITVYIIKTNNSNKEGNNLSNNLNITLKENLNEIILINSTSSSEIKINSFGRFKLFVLAEDKNGKNLTYSWFLNNNLIEGNKSEYYFSGLKKGDYEIKVKISNGNEEYVKSWKVSLGNSLVNFNKYLIFGVIFLLIILIIISFIVINKNKWKIEVKERSNIKTTKKLGTNKLSKVDLQPEQKPLNPVKDYLKRLDV